MIFWSVATLLTLLAVFSVVYPLWRRPRQRVSALDHDREIYHARLNEIDADLALGRLTAGEAEAAKAEEARKLLVISGQPGEVEIISAGRRLPGLILLLVLLIPAFSVLFYLASGQPQMHDMAIASRSGNDLSEQSIEQLLARAEARLAESPGDIRGWLVVAPVYLRLGRVDDAITAYTNALRLDPGNSELKIALAEAIVTGEQGIVVERARQLFFEVLEEQPENARSRFYLAIALSQQGELQKAVQAWNNLIADAPEEAPWLEVARAQLAEVERRLANSPEEETPDNPALPGPDAADIEAASRLSAEQRAEMIESMVSGLADRLDANPDNKPGWRRLIQSYTVLGRQESAREAIAQARRHFDKDLQFLAELDEIEENLTESQKLQ
jgi:cytochrome c-type biogenesis protein CcmH